MAFSDEQASRLVERLCKMEAPQAIIAALKDRLLFEQEHGNEGDLEDILFQCCKTGNWTKPWEKEGQFLTFRARLIGNEHLEHKSDGHSENTPAEEQAYRRGYSHGFAAAKSFAEGYASLIERLSAEEKAIRDWRFEPMHDRDMVAWGPIKLAEYNLQLSLRLTRRSISSSVRYRILERDGFKCRICGRNAADHARLEVDHKTSVRDGGNNHEDNLWTLCFECNRGKGASSLVD